MTAVGAEGGNGTTSWSVGESTIHRIELPLPATVRTVNVYLIEGDEPALIDTGLKTKAGLCVLEARLADLGCSVAAIRHLVITHGHPDHYGLAESIVAASGARVHAHPSTIGRAADVGRWVEELERFQDAALRRAGAPERAWLYLKVGLGAYAVCSESLSAGNQTVPLADGDVVPLGGRAWKVLETPGHTDGLICLYEEGTRTLVSSDLLVPERAYHVVLEPPDEKRDGTPVPFLAFISSLDHLEALSDATILPGHGAGSVTAGSAIANHRRECEERRAQVLAALGPPATVYEIWQLIHGYDLRTDVCQGVLEVQSYLDVLVGEGLAGVDEGDTLDYYAALR